MLDLPRKWAGAIKDLTPLFASSEIYTTRSGKETDLGALTCNKHEPESARLMFRISYHLSDPLSPSPYIIHISLCSTSVWKAPVCCSNARICNMRYSKLSPLTNKTSLWAFTVTTILVCAAEPRPGLQEQSYGNVPSLSSRFSSQRWDTAQEIMCLSFFFLHQNQVFQLL